MLAALLLLLLQLVAAGAESSIQLAVDERQRPGTVVRDLRALVVPAGSMQFSYYLVQAPQFAYKYFTIENTSVLVTKLEIMKDVLLREHLCAADDCRLLLLVNATGRLPGNEDTSVYQLLSLQITVNNVIDQPCKFDKALTTQDVNELSDGQTFINLGNLNCPRLPSSDYLRLSLLDSMGNLVPQNRSSGFRLRHVLIKSKPQSLFRVDLIAPAGLDREVSEWHNFTVVATIGGHETSAKVFVHVDDADDNEPQFQHSSYSLVIREDSPPGEILKLEATDADATPTEFAYTIIGVKCRQVDAQGGAQAQASPDPAAREADADCAKDTFELDARTGALSLRRPLNYEDVSRWTLVCGLRVYGTLVNSTATVNIDVHNVNEAPSMTGCGVDDASRFSVPENLRETHTLCTVKARDEDGDSVKCDLSYDPFATQKFDARRFFQLAFVKQDGGVAQWNLTTAAFPLDYEDERQHRVMILCVDYPTDGRPQLTATSHVLITVENRNDPPTFTQTFYKQAVFENDERRTLLTTSERSRKSSARFSVIIANISVTIDPTFANLSDVNFAILPSSQDHAIDDAFLIKGNNLYVNDGFMFDRESREWYNFSLLARLSSEPSLVSTVPVTIEIIDRNDNSPVFVTNDENMTVEVRIDTAVGRQVYCCVRATDRDKGANGRVQYFIVDDRTETDVARSVQMQSTPESSNYFSIDANSGEILLSKPLNSSLVGQIIRLSIEARDQPAEEDARVASTAIRLQFIRPLQLYVGARDHLPFNFGEFHNMVVIAMIVGVTVLVSGFLIGLIVCIKSKNTPHRSPHQATPFSASINGHSLIKSGNLKVKLQTNSGYSRFRQASPSHYYKVTSYESNMVTEIDYPEPSLAAQKLNGSCIGAMQVHEGNSPLQFAGMAPIAMSVSPVPQVTNESLCNSLANSPKGTVTLRSFSTDPPHYTNASGLPPLNMDLDSTTTDIDSGQGSSTSTSKATDSSTSNNRRSSAETSTDPSEMVAFDRTLQMQHPLQVHDIYCTCTRRHGAATISRSTTPSPLPASQRRIVQPMSVAENCSPVIKSILRGAPQNQLHYQTMLPKRQARNAHNAVCITLPNGEQKRSVLSSSEV